MVVDVERGRTVKSWRPRKLGGGIGGTESLKDVCLRYRSRLQLPVWSRHVHGITQ